MTKKQVTASGPSALNTVGQQGTVWIDVTGVMRWGAQSPTGIQRVEQSIVKYATEQENIGFAYFDDEERRFKPATPAMASYVRYIVYGSWIDGNRNYWAGIRNAAAFLPMQLRFARKEAVRRIANAISGNPGRKGAVYAVVKAAIRLVFWSWFFIRWIGELCRKAFQTFGRRQIEEFPQGGRPCSSRTTTSSTREGKYLQHLNRRNSFPYTLSTI